MQNGRASYGFLQLNEWREEYEDFILYEDSNKKEKGQTISYWIIWLNEEELFMWSHFTTIWNARNFDWWKPVHEDSPFSYVQFPSFGKHDREFAEEVWTKTIAQSKFQRRGRAFAIKT